MNAESNPQIEGGRVTARAAWLGLLLAAFLAGLNCWTTAVGNVYFLGGIQMPFGAIFLLLLLTLPVNWVLRSVQRKSPVVGPVLGGSAFVALFLVLYFWLGMPFSISLGCAALLGLVIWFGTQVGMVNRLVSLLMLFCPVAYFVYALVHLGMGQDAGLSIAVGAAVGLVICLVRFLLANKPLAVFAPAELLTIYAMMVFGALISTPGCDNQFMTTAPTLFYFSTRENNWAELFYKFVPSWMAPGWNGHVFQEKVINPLFLGGLSFWQIPWHAWAVMLLAWSIFLMLIYTMLFFVALMFRKPWLEHEALPFPLVQLPLQMVEVDTGAAAQRATAGAFWSNRGMWVGFAVALIMVSLKGLNAHFPDWPFSPVNTFGGVRITFTDQPWNAMPTNSLTAEVFLGIVGIAYLLTREVSFSFWFFFLLMLLEYPLAQMLGFPVSSMGKEGVLGRPAFIIYQSVGGWVVMAGTLVWMARAHFKAMFKAAFGVGTRAELQQDEIFSPRAVVLGFILSLVGLIAWCAFAGISLFYAAVFMGIFLITSLVLARLVIEGGFLFPQAPYMPVEWMCNGMFGTGAIGAANLTKLSMLQPVILVDTRTTVLPAFLHTLKIAADLRMNRQSQRRLMLCCLAAIVITLIVTYVTTLTALYNKGGLAGYTWFTYEGPKATFTSTASLLHSKPQFDPKNAVWMALGGAVVLLLLFGRSRFVWFPLHPLGYLAAPAYPILRMWFAFFLAWLLKSLLMKFGGSDTVAKVRPFMIGLILGNATAMIIWMVIGFRTGTQMPFWPG